jgi:hypothetical protein
VAAYQWYRAGSPIPGATGASYRVSASDAGAVIQVASTYSRAGRAPVVSRSAAIQVAKVTPAVKVKALKSGKLRITVKAAGLTRPTGKITVKFGTKYSKTYTLKAKNKGKLTKALPKKVKKGKKTVRLARGKYKVTATYSGSSQIAKKSSGKISVRVR